MPVSPRRIRLALIAVLGLSTLSVSRGDTPATYTGSNSGCGHGNPDAPCSGTSGLPDCYNPNGRCVSTEPLCRHDRVTSGSCSNGRGTCQSDGTCKTGSTTTPPPSDCVTTGCPSGQQCTANRCVPSSSVNRGGGGCAGSPARGVN